jgi:hypothetical protein
MPVGRKLKPNYPDHLYTISGVEVTDMTAVACKATEFSGEKSIRPLTDHIAREVVFAMQRNRCPSHKTPHGEEAPLRRLEPWELAAILRREAIQRHPEALASSASLEGWMRQRCLQPILRGSQELAPQDDGLIASRPLRMRIILASQWLCGRISSGIPLARKPPCASQASVFWIARSI